MAVQINIEDSAVAVRELFSKAATRYYGVAFHRSGFGDQLITAASSAKLSEIFGLRFVGVVSETLRLDNRIDDLFEDRDSLGWFETVFGQTIPQISKNDCAIISVKGNFSDICRDLLLQEMKSDTVVFLMSIHDAVKLTGCLNDLRGDYLSNDFFHYYQIMNKNLPGGRWYNSSKTEQRNVHRVVVHVRLGDTLVLYGIKDKHVVMLPTHAKNQIKIDVIKEDAYAAHERNPCVLECAKIIGRLQEEFGDRISIHVVTDGIDRPRHLLNLRSTRDALIREFNVSEEKLDQNIDLSLQIYEDQLSRLFASVPYVCGEGRQQFIESINLLIDAIRP